MVFAKIKSFLIKKKLTIIIVPDIDGNSKALSEALKNVNPKCDYVVVRDKKDGVRVKTLWLS